MKFIGIVCAFCIMMSVARAQDAGKPAPVKLGKNDTIKTYGINYEGQLIPWFVEKEVKIHDERVFLTDADRQAYRQLVYNVHKVMPYARFAADRYAQLQRDLALTSDKHQQKKLINDCNNQIKDLFKREVENLTITQGEILIKLIDRETGNSSYELVSQLKGGLDAFMLQSVARLFGHNLKQTYDPDEDRDIEAILQEAGFDAVKN
jgi:hypothetical protein